MAVADSAWTVDRMRERLVRYADLRPCYNAFIDTRTPGSEAKENFTIIGPGVSENPEQFVHIAEPHGYNIGGARQPPGCVNSQHSHKTAEVFVVHEGVWRFDLGEHGEDAQVELYPGDVISIPTDIFRGFTNIGDGMGFLWAVLGQDDPGRVTWAPKVFEMAREYGLVLLKSGQLIDTKEGEAIPDGQQIMEPTPRHEVAAMGKATQADAKKLVWRAGDAGPEPTTRIIGEGEQFSWKHGFSLERLSMQAGARFESELATDPKVVFVNKGRANLQWGNCELTLGKGDTISVPIGLEHNIAADDDAELFVVRQSDERPHP
ncbi:MAG: cupin domain-containing protein [Pontixanthobacter sp.]